LNYHYENFKEVLQLRFNTCAPGLPSDWICENTYLRSKKFSFDKHEYQLAIANDPHRIVAAEKCAQIGFTEILLRWIICFLVQHQGSQGIFTQPTAADMGNFAKSRVDAVFDECPVIKRLGTGGIDSAQLKKIGSSFINLRGTFGTRAAISVPSDVNVYDEVNFSNPRVLNQYKSRLQHSDYKLERCISTPTVPNYGVSDLVNRSDQKVVMLKCSHCGKQQTLKWPDSIWLNKSTRLGVEGQVNQDALERYIDKEYEYKPYFACEKCEREVDRSWKYREWVAKYPNKAKDLDIGISGYCISQLDVTFVSAADVVKSSDKRLDGYKREEDFHNFVLGKPYAGGDSMKVTDATKILATFIMQLERVNGTFVGVDLGNICHVAVVKEFWLPGRSVMTPVVVATKKIPKEQLEDTLWDVVTMYGGIYTVCDAQPYTTTVEKLALKRKGKMSICFFGGKKPYSMSNENVQVTANRTQTLDAVTEDLSVAKILVASCIENFDEFWKHCKNLVKVKAEDEDGTTYYEYVKVGDDHFGYAFAYALLARRIFYEVRPEGETGLAPVMIDGVQVDI
jgi:hypothetical protein